LSNILQPTLLFNPSRARKIICKREFSTHFLTGENLINQEGGKGMVLGNQQPSVAAII
jgi:hypothetical protein